MIVTIYIVSLGRNTSNSSVRIKKKDSFRGTRKHLDSVKDCLICKLDEVQKIKQILEERLEVEAVKFG